MPPSSPSRKKTLASRVAAGTVSDVFELAEAFVPRAAQDGWALDLLPRLKQDQEDADDFYPAVLAAGRYAGTQVALPEAWSPYIMYVNRGLFEQAQLPLPDHTWTYDRWLEGGGATHPSRCRPPHLGCAISHLGHALAPYPVGVGWRPGQCRWATVCAGLFAGGQCSAVDRRSVAHAPGRAITSRSQSDGAAPDEPARALVLVVHDRPNLDYGHISTSRQTSPGWWNGTAARGRALVSTGACAKTPHSTGRSRRCPVVLPAARLPRGRRATALLPVAPILMLPGHG